MNEKLRIVYDVDGTLITLDDKPRWDVIESLKFWKKLGATIIVHSGCGKDYADLWVRRLFLTDYVDATDSKNKETYADISYDDEVVTYGKINVRV